MCSNRMEKFLVVAIAGLVVSFDGASGIICYYGTTGSLSYTAGCSYCSLTTTTYSGFTTVAASCEYSTCYSGTYSYYTMTCCSTDYCNSISGGSGSGSGTGGSGGSSGLTCFTGMQGSLTSQSGCTSCQKIIYSPGTSSEFYYSSCLSYSCTPSSSSSYATYCCATSNCNGNTLGSSSSSGALSCYDGLQGSLTSRSGCTSCQRIIYTSGMSYAFSSCLNYACTAGTTSSGGYTYQTYCCSTNYCNDDNFNGQTKATGGLKCYDGAPGSLVSKSGCTSCQKMTYTIGSTKTSMSSCLQTTCSATSADYGSMGSSATYCCSSDNCNAADTHHVALPCAAFVALGVIWRFARL